MVPVGVFVRRHPACRTSGGTLASCNVDCASAVARAPRWLPNSPRFLRCWPFSGRSPAIRLTGSNCDIIHARLGTNRDRRQTVAETRRVNLSRGVAWAANVAELSEGRIWLAGSCWLANRTTILPN